MRSAFYLFAEFCHSQCLSHFAASFIVSRAEASIAKNCEVIDTFGLEVDVEGLTGQPASDEGLLARANSVRSVGAEARCGPQ